MQNSIDAIFGLVGAGLELALAIALVRGRFWRREFLFFFLYICYAIADVLGLLVIAVIGNKQLYAHTYWIAQAFYGVLGVLAMNESFRKVFKVYYFRRSWFRFLVPGLLLTILSISVWKWLRQAPIQAGPFTIAYISFDLAVNYMLAGIFGLYGLLVFFWQVRWQQYAFHVMAGFGLFSLVGMLADALRSDFGTRMSLIFGYASAVAYIFACIIWLNGFQRTREGPDGRSGSSIDPEEVLTFLNRATRLVDKRKAQ